MPCTISDIAMNVSPGNTAQPLQGVTVLVQPDAVPVFSLVDDVFREIVNPQRSVVTDVNGAWSVILPWPSETNPASTLWRITTPDLVVWQGSIPNGVDGPLTIYDLKNQYGWAQVSP